MGSDSPSTQQRESTAQSPGRGSHGGTAERVNHDGGVEDIDGFIHRFIDDYIGGENRPAMTPTETVSANENCGVPNSTRDSGGYDCDSGGDGGGGALRKDRGNGIVTKGQHLQDR